MDIYTEDDWEPPSRDPFHREAAALRLAAVTCVSAEPLLRGIAAEGAATLERGDRASILARFDAGELDCVLLPMTDCLRGPACRMIPGIGVCSRGPTGTELLYSKVEPGAMKRVAVHPLAVGMMDLARVILRETFGNAPDFVSISSEGFDPDSADGLLVSDAAAWTTPNPFGAAHDLGLLWEDLTHLPLARLMWLCRNRAPYPRLRLATARALQRGREELDALAGEAAAEHAVDMATVAAHFERNVYFTPGGREIEGMWAYARVATKYGLCDADAAPDFC